MAAVARIGDGLSHGGNITGGSPDVRVVGAQVARVGDAAQCAIHGAVTITTGSAVSLADAKRIARVGDACSCGATITSGAGTVASA